MKKIKLSIVFFALASIVYGQENIIAVNGGYAFIVGQEVKTDLTGWRVMGVYEYNPMGGPLSIIALLKNLKNLNFIRKTYSTYGRLRSAYSI